jgi:hypothetical protein
MHFDYLTVNQKKYFVLPLQARRFDPKPTRMFCIHPMQL